MAARTGQAVSGDHPRIRGEHDLISTAYTWAMGSSPHTRGAPRTGICMRLSIRIIPAYAGSTTGRTGWRPLVRDHPRIRGEHTPAAWQAMIDAGSSPHTRGALSRGGGLAGRCRIIPAYAGSTRAGRPRARRSRDHPRIRGEHGRVVFLAADVVGSSPHTRGARTRCCEARGLKRIIPAYAGSTVRGSSQVG